MTSTNKLLSETHPTLYFSQSEEYRNKTEPTTAVIQTFMAGQIQQHTVDVVEHQKVIAQRHSWRLQTEKEMSKRIELFNDVVRLQKELETLREQDCVCDSYDVGLVEGERRAMERVKASIVKLRYVPFVGSSKAAVSDLRVLDELSSELGLDKEVVQ